VKNRFGSPMDHPSIHFWQLSYYLARPLKLRRGATIECIAHYDNSPNNPRNPNPTGVVRFGDQSTAEMMIGYLEVAVDLDLDMKDVLTSR
jgi:hypothetical protein